MAVAKKATKASNKSKDTKASSSKKVIAKPVAKQPVKAVPNAKSAVKKDIVTKAAPAKKVLNTTNVKKQSDAKKPAAKTATPVKNAPPVKSAVKVVDKAKAPVPVKGSEAPKKVVAKEVPKPVPTPAKKSVAPAPAAKSASVSKAKPTALPKTPAPAVKTTPAPAAKSATTSKNPAPAAKSSPTSKIPVPSVKGKTKPELDPADAKAKKIMKELAETMDLSKVKSRIKVPQPAPKPVYRQPPSAPLKLIEPTNTNKLKFQLEFEFRSSPKILFNALSDSSGLAGWFADEVRTKDDQFTFVWEGGESYARLVAMKDMHLVRFQWAEDIDGTYFQFEIKQDELTGEIALVITDFALPGEREANIRLWESQVQNLRMLLGSL